MKKKVGNIILLSIILLLSQNVFASDRAITLRIQDMNYDSIRQVMLQVPFVLQVELQNLEGYTEQHVLQNILGIENFTFIRTTRSQNISIYNGKRIVKTLYNFILAADKKGSFSVGPLCLEDTSNQVVRSNKIIIDVGDEIVSSEKKQKGHYFVTMELDKKQAYVGEKIGLSIKFYDQLSVDNLHLQFPEFKNLYIFKNQNGVQKSVLEVDQEEYSVSEWKFDVYATESGRLIFQDIQAAFFAPEQRNGFGGALDFFRSFHRPEQYIIAKPVKVDIVPLPKSDTFSNVVAVGQFSKYNISYHQDSAPAGQGIAVTVELYGDGNFEMISPCKFILPKGFNYYDSNMMTIDAKRNCKRSEFIVQADTPGVYHIQSQLFVYFDPQTKQYYTLKSNEADITVTPALYASSEQQQDNILKNDVVDTIKCDQKTLKDFKYIHTGVIHQQKSIAISSSLFLLILRLLFLMWVFMVGYVSFFKKYVLNHRLWQKFILFYQAKKLYQTALAEQNIAKLQMLFHQLFAQLIGISVGKLSNIIIIEYLKSKNFTDDMVDDWNLFHRQILQASFSAQNKMNQEDIFVCALQWIERLKEKV